MLPQIPVKLYKPGCPHNIPEAQIALIHPDGAGEFYLIEVLDARYQNYILRQCKKFLSTGSILPKNL